MPSPTKATVLLTIPNGFKDKLLFLFDSSENIHRRKNSQHSTFADDCGSWDTQWKNNKRTFHYNAKQPVEMDNEKGRYFPNQENRKKTYTPYNPQPENVIILRRYYSTLKRDKSYKKRVSWFDMPEQYLSRSHIAVIEYIGVSPR